MVAMVRRSDDLARASLEIFFLIALFTLPAYVSGGVAFELLKSSADVSAAALAAHRNAALFALVVIEIAGAVAWYGLWKLQRTHRLSRRTLAAVAACGLIALAVAAQAAYVGGHIRHPEIVDAQSGVAPAAGWLDAGAMSEYILNHLWIWPTNETLHFIGMSLTFGVLLLVNGHLLGFLKNVPFATVHRLLPLGMAGFAVNMATGMVFFTGVPDQYTENPTFHLKILLLMFAGLDYLFLTSIDAAGPDGVGERLPLRLRVVAVSSLCLWASVMYLGVMLPYLRGNL
jgi:hypothetical protein